MRASLVKPLLFAALAIAFVLASAAVRRNTRGADAGHQRAVQLFDDAMSQRVAGQHGRTRSLLADAYQADPAWLLPVWEIRQFIGTNTDDDAVFQRMRASASATGDATLASCVGYLLDLWHPRRPADSLAIGASPAALRCVELLRLQEGVKSASERVDQYSRGRLRYPQSPSLVRLHIDALLANGQYEQAIAEARIALGASHPAVRVQAAVGAHALHALGRHDQAIALEQVARRVAQSAGPGALMDYYALPWHEPPGDSARSAAELAHARATSVTAIAELKRLEPLLDQQGRARLLSGLVDVSVGTNDLISAAEAATRLYPLADSLNAVLHAVSVQARAGHLLVKIGRYEEAERMLLGAADRARALGSHDLLREPAHNLLHLREARGRYADAVVAGETFYRAASGAGHDAGQMMAQHDLAWLHLRNGQIRAAQHAFDNMLRHLERLGGLYTYFAGEYYGLIGALEQARASYLIALDQWGDRSRALAGVVRVSQALGDTATALHYARISDRAIMGYHPEHQVLLPGVLTQLGRFAEARAALEHARVDARTRSRVTAFARLTLELADVHQRAGSHAAAALLADSAALLARDVGLVELRLEAEALALAADRNVPLPSLATRYASITRAARKLGAPLLMSRIHRLRGDAFAARNAVDDALAAYADAAASIDTVVNRMSADHNRANYRAAQLDASDRALGLIVQSKRHDANARFATWSMWRKGARWIDGRAALSQLQPRLGSDRAFIDYAVLDTGVAALVVTADRISLHVLPVTAKSLLSDIDRLRNHIAPRFGSPVDAGRISFDFSTAHRLYGALLQPLLPVIGERQRLIISADREIHALPMDALVVKLGSDTTYVVDRFVLANAPSLELEVSKRRRPDRLVAIAGSEVTATGADSEIAALRTSGIPHVSVIAEENVSAIREKTGAADIVHFATHAEPNDREPQFARLLIGREWVHAYELAQWPLSDALIVLSACETAAGSIAGGEGTLSLSRAFMHAGARATIATLWPIGEPTTTLMEEFYRRHAAGADLADALRQGRLVLRRGPHSHPFYWAPFTLTVRGI